MKCYSVGCHGTPVGKMRFIYTHFNGVWFVKCIECLRAHVGTFYHGGVYQIEFVRNGQTEVWKFKGH